MAWAGGVLCQQYFSWVQYEILSTGSGKFQSAGKGDYILLFWRGVPVVFRVRRGFLEVQSADIGHDLLINRAFDDVRQVVGPCAQPERLMPSVTTMGGVAAWAAPTGSNTAAASAAQLANWRAAGIFRLNR